MATETDPAAHPDPPVQPGAASVWFNTGRRKADDGPVWGPPPPERDQQLQVRVSLPDKQLIAEAARRRNVSVSEFVRTAALAAARLEPSTPDA